MFATLTVGEAYGFFVISIATTSETRQRCLAFVKLTGGLAGFPPLYSEMGTARVPRSYGPWKILATHSIYRDPWIELDRDDVIRPDGLPGSHCVVRLKPGVCVLALDSHGDVHLTEEFHYGIGRISLEAVSGGIERAESPLETARRELEEELGIVAGKWTELGTIDPFTTVVVSPTQLFLAEELTYALARQEGTELIRPVRMPLSEALQQVESGAISHAPTCVLILRAARLRNVP